MPVREDYFKGFMGLFATGVTVVTTRTGGSAYGLTVSSFTSVSLQPQLILICLDNKSSGLDRFLKGEYFAVNILAEDQQDLSTHFASPGTDRSESTGLYTYSKKGTPLLKDCLGMMECRLTHTYPAGDHTIVLGEVVSLKAGEDLDRGPLLYYRARYGRLSFEPVSGSYERDSGRV